jgi:hypothetical protein
MSHLGRGFVSVPPHQPRRIVLTLKRMQRQTEFFDSIKGGQPSQIRLQCPNEAFRTAVGLHRQRHRISTIRYIRVAVEGWSVTQATHAFGCSRPIFYHARTAFEHEGLTGLIPHKRGPKDAHKLSTDVMIYVAHLLQDTPQLSSQQLTQAIVEYLAGLSIRTGSYEP